MGSLERDLGQIGGKVRGLVAERLSGSVLDKALERAILAWDQESRDKFIIWETYLMYQFGRGHGGKTGLARKSGLKWIKGWLDEGRTFLRASEYAGLLLDGFNFEDARGVEKIPEGPTYYCMNHPKGLMHGNWYTFAVGYHTAKARGVEHEPRWFHAEWSNEPLIEKTSLRILYTRGAQMMSAACNNLLFTRDRDSVMKVVGEAQNELTGGRSIAMSVEAAESGQFHRVHRGIGRLYMAITGAGNFPVTPVGVWRNKDDLNVRFGEPFYLRDLLGDNISAIFDKGVNQRAADKIGLEIAKQLPAQHRGYYGALTGR